MEVQKDRGNSYGNQGDLMKEIRDGKDNKHRNSNIEQLFNHYSNLRNKTSESGANA